MSLLLVVLSLPLFTHQFNGDGEITAIGCIEKTAGYFAVCTTRNYPGGLPDCLVVYLDESGTATLSYNIGNGLEALELCSFAGKKAILARRPAMNYSTVSFVGGADLTLEFQDQFMETAVMSSQPDHLVIAGNDHPGDTSIRIATIDGDFALASNILYPGLNMIVADVSMVNGEICVLGSTEQAGWQRDLTLFFPGTMTELHFQPFPGRFTPVEILTVEDGCIIVANAATEQNGMIGEIFLMRMSAGMTQEWTASLGGASWLNASAADITAEGVVLSGWTNDLALSESNRSDLLIAEFSAEGQLLWTREYGGSTVDYGLEVETCTDGGFLVSGCFAAGYYDGLLMRTDSLGTLDGMGLEEETPSGPVVSVMSNPSRGNTIRVSIENRAPMETEVRILDIAGRTVRVSVAESGHLTFAGLPPGIYMVVATSEGEQASVSVAVTGGDR